MCIGRMQNVASALGGLKAANQKLRQPSARMWVSGVNTHSGAGSAVLLDTHLV